MRRMKMIFKHACPLCSAQGKMVKRCKKCLRYSCSECSIGDECIDCYTASKHESIAEEYFEDKYRLPTGVDF